MLKRGLELVIEAAVDWEIGCGQSPMGWRVMEKSGLMLVVGGMVSSF
jgi:hypothetical protein